MPVGNSARLSNLDFEADIARPEYKIQNTNNAQLIRRFVMTCITLGEITFLGLWFLFYNYKMVLENEIGWGRGRDSF